KYLEEVATFNLRSLDITYKVDTVRDNDFYFIAKQDGYDASRILNETFLDKMYAEIKGEMAVAVPHQDVVIIAYIVTKSRNDIQAQLAIKFFAKSRNPITSLALIYEDKNLEPVFIMAKNKPTKE